MSSGLFPPAAAAAGFAAGAAAAGFAAFAGLAALGRGASITVRYAGSMSYQLMSTGPSN